MKGSIIQHFHASAATYDQSAAMQRISAQRLASLLPRRQNLEILEIGCGTGILTSHLLDIYKNSRIFSLDIAPNMIKKCKERFSIYPNIHFACLDMDTARLPLKFDLIVSNMALHWLSEGVNNLQSIMANLIPGGELFFAVPGAHSFQEWKQACHENQLEDGILPFTSIEELKQHYPLGNFYNEINKQSYVNAYEFLQSFKQLGTQTPRKGYKPLAPGYLRRIARHLNHQFPNTIEITYEVIYGACQHL